MLWTPHNEFNWKLDNWGTTFTGAAMGTVITAHATNAHVKGTAVSIFAGSVVIADVYEVWLVFNTPSATGTRFFADLLVDPAGGTSWSVLINNIAINTPSFAMNGAQYFFPIYITAGSSIGIQVSCSTANTTVRAMVSISGKPSRPDLVQVGSVVETIGAVTATTVGTAFTPGAGTIGSYSAALGTTTRDCWFWQLGILIDDTTQTANAYVIMLEAGDATNKVSCGRGFVHAEPSTTETAGKSPFPMDGLPYRRVPKGASLYVRGATNGTADSNNSAVAYGIA